MKDSPTTMRPSVITGRVQVVAAISLSILCGYNFLFAINYDPLTLDYRVFWETARRAAPYANSHDAIFVNPPTALIWIKPLALFHFWPGYAALSIASIGAFVLAAARASNWRSAFIALFSAAAIQGLALGQLAMLLGAAILWAVTLSSLACGMILGVVASIKPQLLLMAPVIFIARRDCRALVGMAVGGISSVGLSLLFGAGLWIDWFREIQGFQGLVYQSGIWPLTISPTYYAYMFGLPTVLFMSFGAMAALTAIATWKLERASLAAMMVGTSLLVSPYALTHDLIAATPAIAALLAGRPTIRAIPAGLVFIGLLVPLMMAAIALSQVRRPSLRWRWDIRHGN